MIANNRRPVKRGALAGVSGEETELARKLAKLGMPVFWARISGPKDSPSRDGWSDIPASYAPEEIALWSPPKALCARTGHTFDVFDHDPRNDPDGSGYDGLIAAFRKYKPTIYLKLESPSGGSHFWVASLGENAQATNLPGVDYLGYGRLVFIPPTKRRAKGEDGFCHGPKLPYVVTYENLDAPLEPCDGLRGILDRTSSNGHHRTTDDAVRDMLDARPGTRNNKLWTGVTGLAGAGVEPATIIRIVAPALRDAGWKAKRGTIENDIRDILKRDDNAMSDEDRDELRGIEPHRPADIPPNLPVELYDSYGFLQHIRQAAFSRGRSPDGALLAVLTRVSAIAPPWLRCNAGMGPASLTIFGALCGPTGKGKGQSKKIGMDLIPDLLVYEGMEDDKEYGGFADDEALASGQGIGETYMGSVREEAPDGALLASGKPKMIEKRQKVRSHAFFYADEGESLANELQDKNSKVGATIRSAASSETIGAANAGRDTRRKILGGTYSIGILVGFQPITIGPLISDEEKAKGTTSRLLYFSVMYRGIPREERPDWPGRLAIEWPGRDEIITFAPEIEEEIRNADADSTEGYSSHAPGTEHANLMRMRIASHIVTLDGRTHVTKRDWYWAGIVWDGSSAVRAWMEREYGKTEEITESKIQGKLSGREVAKRDAVEERSASLKAALGLAARHMAGPADGRNCPRSGHSRRCATIAAGKYMKDVKAEILFARLLADGYITEEAGVLRKGRRSAPQRRGSGGRAHRITV